MITCRMTCEAASIFRVACLCCKSSWAVVNADPPVACTLLSRSTTYGRVRSEGKHDRCAQNNRESVVFLPLSRRFGGGFFVVKPPLYKKKQEKERAIGGALFRCWAVWLAKFRLLSYSGSKVGSSFCFSAY